MVNVLKIQSEYDEMSMQTYYKMLNEEPFICAIRPLYTQWPMAINVALNRPIIFPVANADP